jgi:hypothetical protein
MAVPIRSEPRSKPRRRLWLVESPPAWFVAAGRVAASIIAALTVSYGAIAVSASVDPDSLLYPIKIVIEDVSIAVAPAEHRADLLVNQANRRLDESQVLAEEGQVDRAERLVEDASQKIEGAKALVQRASDPSKTSRSIETTASRATRTDESLERNKSASEPKLGAPAPVVAPPPVVYAPAPVIEPSTKPPVQDEPTSLPVEAYQPPAGPAGISGVSRSAPVVPAGGGGAASASNSIGAGQVGAPVVVGPAAAVQVIESNDAPVATATRGAVVAPQETVVTLEQVAPPVVLPATSTPTTPPVRTPTVAPTGTPAGSASAPTSGVTVLPAGGSSGSTAPDPTRPAR